MTGEGLCDGLCNDERIFLLGEAVRADAFDGALLSRILATGTCPALWRDFVHQPTITRGSAMRMVQWYMGGASAEAVRSLLSPTLLGGHPDVAAAVVAAGDADAFPVGGLAFERHFPTHFGAPLVQRMVAAARANPRLIETDAMAYIVLDGIYHTQQPFGDGENDLCARLAEGHSYVPMVLTALAFADAAALPSARSAIYAGLATCPHLALDAPFDAAMQALVVTPHWGVAAARLYDAISRHCESESLPAELSAGAYSGERTYCLGLALRILFRAALTAKATPAPNAMRRVKDLFVRYIQENSAASAIPPFIMTDLLGRLYERGQRLDLLASNADGLGATLEEIGALYPSAMLAWGSYATHAMRWRRALPTGGRLDVPDGAILASLEDLFDVRVEGRSALAISEGPLIAWWGGGLSKGPAVVVHDAVLARPLAIVVRGCLLPPSQGSSLLTGPGDDDVLSRVTARLLGRAIWRAEGRVALLVSRVDELLAVIRLVLVQGRSEVLHERRRGQALGAMGIDDCASGGGDDELAHLASPAHCRALAGLIIHSTIMLGRLPVDLSPRTWRVLEMISRRRRGHHHELPSAVAGLASEFIASEATVHLGLALGEAGFFSAIPLALCQHAAASNVV